VVEKNYIKEELERAKA